MKPECLRHDRANLYLLPLLGAAAVLGLLGFVNTVTVTAMFTWYIVIDFVWIAVQPEAIPSLPSIILFHHAVTFVLLLFPLRYPQLGTYTCWDGLVEINTLFLIARRQLRTGRRLWGALYWASFFPLRMGLYPYLLVQFYREMQPFRRWELATVCGCQLILCGFNCAFLALSIMSWRKRGSRPGSPASGKGAARAGAAAAAGAGAALKPHMLEARARVTVQAKVV